MLKVLVVALGLRAAAAYDPWPLPLSYSVGTTSVSVDPTLSFEMANGAQITSPILAAAFARYAASITDGFACSAAMQASLDRSREHTKTTATATNDRAKAGAASGILVACAVTVADQAQVLSEGTDESYSLSVAGDGACELTAATVPGALRGLETLSQLAGEACRVENAPVKVCLNDPMPRISLALLLSLSLSLSVALRTAKWLLLSSSVAALRRRSTTRLGLGTAA